MDAVDSTSVATGNAALANALEELASLLGTRKVDRFRIRAYERAAALIRDLPIAAATMPPETLRRLEGVGDALTAVIGEYASTGTIARLEQLRAEEPPGTGVLLRLPLIGLRDARTLAGTHGIGGVAELAAAVDSEERRAALGERLASRAAESLRRLRDRETGQPLPLARRDAAAVAGHLADIPTAAHIDVAGAVRRGCETSTTTAVVITTTDVVDVRGAVRTHPHVLEVLADDGPLTVVTTGGRQVDVWVTTHEHRGPALVAATGSDAHVGDLNDYGRRTAVRLSDDGLWRGEDRLAAADEHDCYAAFGLPWIPPELREGAGEVAAAAAGRLPDLVDRRDVVGDLHVHTDWSRDGKDGLADMVTAAAAVGHRYVALTDHAENLTINGMPREKVLARREAIRAAQGQFPDIRILDAAELNIGLDGGIDYDPEFLLEFDFTVASIHSHMDRPVAEQTDRILAAIANPAVDVIGHPTGRILNHRPAYPIELDAIAQAAAETGTALEVNGSPRRLDLSSAMVRAATAAGARIALSSDAHNTTELAYLDNAVTVARRGWAEAADVVNAGAVEALLDMAKRKRSR